MKKWFWVWVWGWIAVTAVGCTQSDPSSTANPTAGVRPPLTTVVPLPTAYPTLTPGPNEVSIGAATPAITTQTTFPPAPTATPIDFSQPVISLTVRIPAVDLHRTITGTLGGVMTVSDRTSGVSRTEKRQQALLLQIRQALRDATPTELPTDCNGRCVQIGITLPIDGVDQSGWVEDEILSASLHRLFDEQLGPHFPPETAFGLWRSISPYNVSHTAVLLPDGTVWRWMATDTEIAPAVDAADTAADLIRTAADLPVSRLENTYVADCDQFPAERMYIQTADIAYTADMRCPQITLPRPLTDIYAQLTELIAPLAADARNLPRPTYPLPLDALAYYKRLADGAHITLYADGRAVAVDAAGTESTRMFDPEELRQTLDDLIREDVVPRGAGIIVEDGAQTEYEELLLLRGELGVYELGWSDRIGQALSDNVTLIELLLTNQVGLVGDVAPVTPTPAPSPTATAVPTTTLRGYYISTEQIADLPRPCYDILWFGDGQRVRRAFVCANVPNESQRVTEWMSQPDNEQVGAGTVTQRGDQIQVDVTWTGEEGGVRTRYSGRLLDNGRLQLNRTETGPAASDFDAVDDLTYTPLEVTE